MGGDGVFLSRPRRPRAERPSCCCCRVRAAPKLLASPSHFPFPSGLEFHSTTTARRPSARKQLDCFSTRPIHSFEDRIASDRIGFLRSDQPLPSPADSTPSSPVQVTFTTHFNPSPSYSQWHSSDLPYPGDPRDCPKPRVADPLCLASIS